MFTNLEDLPIAYKQAFCAYKYGENNNLNYNLNIFSFPDIRFNYMLRHSLGEFNVNEILPIELKKILYHDKTSSVQYWETLRIYLKSGLNSTKTANSLYIHRSTFLARIQQIEKILGQSLDDYDFRLYIGLCMEIYDRFSDCEHFNGDK